MNIFRQDDDRAVVRLDCGWPARELQALSTFQSMVAKCALEDDFSEALFYGERAGGVKERTNLATMLSMFRTQPVLGESIVLSAGSGAALDLLLGEHRSRSNVVFTEELSYHNALTMIRDHGYETQPLPACDLGILDLDAVDAAFAKHSGALCYLVPTFSNPLGTTLRSDQRKLLVECARKHGVRIIADEVYRLLSFEDEAPPTFASYDQSGDTVVSLGSFTKIAGPGLRLGWMEFGGGGAASSQGSWRQAILDRGVVVNGGCLNQFSAWCVGKWLENSSFESHLNEVRRRLKRRADALWLPLRRELNPAQFRIEKPDGGYFIWLQCLDSRVDLHGRLVAGGVMSRPKSDFLSQSGRATGFEGVRLSFSWLTEAALADAARTIVQVLG